MAVPIRHTTDEERLTAEEMVWIGRLLQVLRSDKPRLADVAKGILRELAESATMWD